VHGRRLEFATLDVTGRCLDTHAVPKPLAQVQLDSISGKIGPTLSPETRLSGVSWLAGWRRESWQRVWAAWNNSPGKNPPILELHLLAFADNLENSIVALAEPFAEFLVCLLPVLGEGRFRMRFPVQSK